MARTIPILKENIICFEIIYVGDKLRTLRWTWSAVAILARLFLMLKICLKLLSSRQMTNVLKGDESKIVSNIWPRCSTFNCGEECETDKSGEQFVISPPPQLSGQLSKTRQD